MKRYFFKEENKARVLKKLFCLAFMLLSLHSFAQTITCSYTQPPGEVKGNLSNDRRSTQWTQTNKAAPSDDEYMKSQDIGLADTSSSYCFARLFGFSFPAGAIITGFSMNLEKHRDINGCFDLTDYQIYLTTDGNNLVTLGNNKADQVTSWPTSDAISSYGGTNDMWGTTLTAAQISSGDFGLLISVGNPGAGSCSKKGAAYIDNLTLTVHYTVPTGSPCINPLATTAILDLKYREVVGGHIQLVWNTRADAATASYRIEYLSSSGGFMYLGNVNVDSKDRTDYSFTDTNPLPGMNTYRISMLTSDGRVQSSEMLTTLSKNTGSDGLELLVYPNPVLRNSSIYASISGATPDSDLLLEVMDATGKIVRSKIIHNELEPEVTIDLDLDVLASSSLYYIRVTDLTAGKIASQKFIVGKTN